MRKIIFILFAITVVGCKKTKEETTVRANEKAITSLEDCEDLYKEMEGLNMAEVQQWLNENGHLICDNNLEYCIETYHDIESETVFQTMAGRHPENSTEINFYRMTLSEIENAIAENGAKCYEKYIGFVFVDDKMELKFEPFKDTESFYSIPFITGLRQSLKLKDDSEFKFTKSYDVAQTTMKVIFTVKDSVGEMRFYNISQDPRIRLF